EEVQKYNKDQIGEAKQELVESYKAAVAESFGSVVEEELIEPNSVTTAKPIDKDKDEDQASSKQGKKRLFFGFR
ncbi:MAG: hypothetical protein GX288_02250, partial [Clostridiales bacterium]|nr:hypothetical protein [Clostridiales bacterium]